VNAVVTDMRTEILQTIYIVIENIAISRRQTVVVHYFSNRIHDVIQFAAVVSSMSQHLLELIQLLLGPCKPVLIGAEREGDHLHVVEILPDASEKVQAPRITPEHIRSIMVKGIPIAVRSRTMIVKSAVTFPTKSAIVFPTLDRRRRIPPHDVEGIAFRTATGIVNANDRRPAIARIAHQLLTTPAVDAGKTKIARIPRQRPGAFKPPPSGRRARKVPKVGGIAANLHLSCAVHHYLNGAFPPTWRSSADQLHPAPLALGVHRATDGCEGNYRKQKTCVH